MLPGMPPLALAPGPGLSQQISRSWHTSDGLPAGAVAALAQSAEGFLWIGTQDGLARFDGIRFTVFNLTNTPALHNNFITALCPSRDGGIWIGTFGAGVLHWAGGAFLAWSAAAELPSLRVRSLLEDSSGNVWIGMEGGGLAVLKDRHVRVYTTRDGLPGNSVRCLAEGPDGSLWIGTDRHGLSRFKDGKFVTFATNDGLPSTGIRSLLADAAGGVWVGTMEAGLAYLRDGKSTRYGLREGLPGLTVSSLLLDRSGTLWAGTMEGGLARFKNGVFETCRTLKGFPERFVLALAQDHEGNIWAGTVNGLTQFMDSDFVTYTKEDGLPDDIALCTYEDREGNLWVGTTDGVAEIPRSGPIRALTPKEGLPGSTVFAIHEDRAGTLWFGIQGHGVVRIKDGRFESLTTKDGLLSDDATSFCDAGDNGLWVGTRGGLSLMQDGEIRNFTLHNGQGAEGVTALALGQDGALWVGSNMGILQRLKDKAWTSFGPEYGSPAVPVTTLYSIYEDEEHALWLGSSVGVIRFKDGKSFVFTRKNGLLSDSVYQVLEDGQGRLWMASNRGVLVVRKADLERVANASAGVVTCASYDVSDGMKSAECNGGGTPSGCRLRDGRLCFPTMRGLAVLDPARVQADKTAPSTAIEGMRAEGEDLALVQGASLHAGLRRIGFQYTAPSFRAPEKIRFRFRLLGYDKEWIEAGARRETYYTNLAPGDYSFSVMARSRDGVWGTPAPPLSFTVRPFFYQTKTFAVFCVLLAFGIAFTGHRLVLVQLRAHNAVLHERTRIARDIHDTVAQGLTGVALQLNTVERLLTSQPDAAHVHLARARELLTANLKETQRAIGALRVRHLEEDDLPSALRRLGDSMTKDGATKFSVEVLGRVRPLRDRAAGEDLWKIAQEAIVNALRHAKCNNIHVLLEYSPGTLRATVRDDGPGFELTSAGDASHGLLGMRERAQERGWNLDITSAQGLGTTVSVSVPLSRWPVFWTC